MSMSLSHVGSTDVFDGAVIAASTSIRLFLIMMIFFPMCLLGAVACFMLWYDCSELIGGVRTSVRKEDLKRFCTAYGG